MAKQRRPAYAHLSGADNAQLRLARLQGHTPQGVPLDLGRRPALARQYGTLMLPAAHPSITVPLHAHNAPTRR